jgi:ADP-ribosylglycohydrolase
MIGAIAGDIIGSDYEWKPQKDLSLIEIFKEGSAITDDTVASLAVAKFLMEGGDPSEVIRKACLHWLHIKGGFGLDFCHWIIGEKDGPYNSWGNGAAMRISAAAWLSESVEDAAHKAKIVTEITHNHPEGIRGAQAIAVATRMLLEGWSKQDVRSVMEGKFAYALDRTIDQIRPCYTFEVSCQKTVPEAITCFLESDTFEECVTLAISLGGDADTLACIAGGLFHAYDRTASPEIMKKARTFVPDELKATLHDFDVQVSQKTYPRTCPDKLPYFVPSSKPDPVLLMQSDEAERYHREMSKMEAFLAAPRKRGLLSRLFGHV